MLLRTSLALPIAATLLTLASCSSNSSSDSASIPPERVLQAVAQVDGIVNDIMARTGVPGIAVAVVHKGQTIYAKGFGVRRVGDATPVDADTVFQLASISKSVGATVVAAQVSKGIIGWDTPLVQHLPWFALHDPDATRQVTVGDMYAHRSGLPEHAGDDLEMVGYDRREVLERLRYLATEPLRTRYKYTNFGLTGGAEAVAVASGIDWESLSDRELYRPLDMRSTSSRYADFMARSNRAYPHLSVNGSFRLTQQQRQPDPQSPAGGVSSSVNDMAKWMALVLHEGEYQGRQIIPRATLLPALSPQMQTSPATEDSAASYYGYGFNISTTAGGYTMYGHSGAFLLGTGTAYNLLPAADTGIVVLTNAWPVGAAESISMSFMDLVQFGEISRNWLDVVGPLFSDLTKPTGEFVGQSFPLSPTPALPVHAYVGTYTNDYFGDMGIIDQAGQLALVMSVSGKTIPLDHWDANIYVFEPDGELAAVGSRYSVKFAIGPGGMAQSVTIELLDEYGLGTLTRR
ncbi:serine hydrolase [Pollutimonas harenae]|uniref:Serine hydrolase n=1 Tax=Pollutimonas harenae TaxID=657015 RepID=A0A853GV56_9BURK|nr:serine hydrolase [Pollutimonas harenae]NYT86017.1 serine hydrolase [Pollutimonas harenae]TEA71065.1 serine hydrolase [Pollutimonas harenae]